MKKLLSLLFVIITIVAMPSNIQAQVYAATKEKIYIHTSHVFFKPGEVLYFKVYVVNAQNQKPSRISNVVYAELVSPAGTVVQKVNYAVQDGYAEGSFDFTEQSVGGIYKIRAYTSWMQNETENTFFVKEVTLQKVLAPRVMMKLDFPEKGYGAGDLVSANFSMRNLSDMPVRNYSGKYAVAIGGEVIIKQTFKTDSDGKAVIRFSLPQNLSVNDGLLNITIDYDAYTEAISRSIPIVLNKIDLQFMPEGGTLLQGISSNIAFKALNENGKAADIKGEVKDSKGNTVAVFQSYHFGMGKFTFTPKKGEFYKAIITSPSNIKQTYELPIAAANGVVMHISKEQKRVTVSLHASMNIDVQLRGCTRNVVYHVQKMQLHKGLNEVVIDESIFPTGIAQFTIYNINEIPLAERLVFMNEHQQLQVNITTNKKKYLPREKVLMTINTRDETGKPVPSNFSLSVLDDKLWSFADDKQEHIFSWLLLSSELKGKIEEPQFYFKKDELKSIPALDLVMLTHGYRYFDYIEHITREGSLKYMPDQDNIVSGIILNAANKPAQAKLFLINAVPNGKAMQITTAKDGSFFFSDLLARNSYYLFAQAIDKEEKIFISVLQNGTGYNPTKAASFKQLLSKPIDFPMAGDIATVIPKLEAKQFVELDKMERFAKKASVLNEVVVVGYSTQKKKDITGAVSYIKAEDLIGGNSLNMALQGRVAGIQINNNANLFAESKIRVRGASSISSTNEPLWVVDGMVMQQLAINTLNPNDIESITVLKDATATTLYGSQAANGVIIIESKKNRWSKLQLKTGNKYHYTSQQIYTSGNNYSVARKFYVPAYTTTKTETRTDFRETIYWNPTVQTDKDGNASVSFYNSDASTTFRAIAEGIGYNGKLGRAEATYAVQNALQVDAKIPPYLTVGDEALIPLVIKNNGTQNESFSVKVAVPEYFKAGTYSEIVNVPADSAVQVLIPLQATAAAKGSIQFTVSGQVGIEKIILPIEANDKGFPVKLVFSGNQSVQQRFNISKMISGSLQSNLKLYKNLEGQLLDGIESMLREPYGCFEQTSSTTYPNIFVLKYLREAGKSNPEIEKKALDYIQRGYKRLIGFETSQDGFEWFGKTPPHEALTAYGLLEFTDIQEFIDVDKKMLERTKKFLLGRRDGKGGFNLVSQGLDKFASVPAKIANVYIVYALTQAGLGKEILPEFTSAVAQAISSKDGYKLAMTAIAAHNMKDNIAYNKLMDELNKLQQKGNLNAETSVVNSRDASLRVETNALYAIALLKAPNPDLGKVAVLISKIMGEKSYYGYGSTQATVMALQAIVAYSKFVSKVSADAPVSFTMNNNIVDNNILKQNVKEGDNYFTVNYPRQDKAIPYNLELSYNTFTPPNSDKADLKINAVIKSHDVHVGETVRMEISVMNTKSILQPMAIAKIGIPAGLSAQPWQLKEIMEKNQAAYYEIFDNYLVFYWMGFAPNETKTINLDLKAEVPGTYKAKASNTYLYYTPEYKNWNDGETIVIRQ
jgi:alpha-2-macroglobulin-like protein